MRGASARGCRTRGSWPASADANWATGANRSAGALAKARASAPATPGRHLRAEPGDRRRRRDRMLVEQALRGRAGERRLAGEHLVEHAGQAVEVAPPIEVRLAGGLLRAHVRRRADRHARSASALAAGGADRLRDPEVGHDGVAALEQDVLRLDVAVDRRRGRGRSSARRRPRARCGARRRRGSCFSRSSRSRRDSPSTAASRRTGARPPRPSRRAAGCADGAGWPRSRSRGGNARRQARRELRLQHLDRDLAVVLEVLGNIDGGHAPFAELALDLVAAGERGGQPALSVAHGTPAAIGTSYPPRMGGTSFYWYWMYTGAGLNFSTSAGLSIGLSFL